MKALYMTAQHTTLSYWITADHHGSSYNNSDHTTHKKSVRLF